MTTQYGFFIDSSRCTGCKTCELACKDYKDLTPEVSFRRIYEYAGGDWQEDNGVWHQNVFAYYLSISCNHCEDPRRGIPTRWRPKARASCRASSGDGSLQARDLLDLFDLFF